MSGSVDFLDGAVGDQAEAAFGAHLALLAGDELDVPPGHVAHHFVGADRVLRGQLVEYEDGYLHDRMFAARAAGVQRQECQFR